MMKNQLTATSTACSNNRQYKFIRKCSETNRLGRARHITKKGIQEQYGLYTFFL